MGSVSPGRSPAASFRRPEPLPCLCLPDSGPRPSALSVGGRSTAGRAREWAAPKFWATQLHAGTHVVGRSGDPGRPSRE
jgi:hypothetical protein